MQLQVDTQREVLTWLCTLVEFTIAVTPLDSSVGIAQQDLDTLHAAQLLLIITLNAELTDIVARLIIIILLDIGG